MSRIPEFAETIQKMLDIHERKNDDYATSTNPFSNFDVSEYIISLFNSNRDKTFAWPIATKLARLATILNSDKKPNNESIEDSMVDIANYIILWKCDLGRRDVKLENCKMHETSSGNSCLEDRVGFQTTKYCGASVQYDNGARFMCTRPPGHEGDHGY